MMGIFRLLIVLLSMAVMACALTPSSSLSEAPKQRLKKVFTESLRKADLASVAYAILGYKLLGEPAPPNAPQLCQKLQKFVEAADVSVGDAYQATAAAKDLSGCQLKLGKAASDAVNAALASDQSVGNLYHAALAQINMGQAIDKAAVAKLLSAALNKDDSVASLGHAFNLAAAALDGASKDVKAVFDRVEDAIVQADEVDGKILQFEGGLSVTHLVVSGAYKLAGKIGKAPPITKAQAVKFANYFLGRKSVQHSKGAYFVLESLTTLAGNKFHVPVAVTFAASNVVSESSPSVRVRVTDLLGKSLGKMDVAMESATKVGGGSGSVLSSKTKMVPVAGDDTLYEANFLEAAAGSKPAPRGFYELSVRATPAKADERLAGNDGAVLTVKVLSQVTVEDVVFGTGDTDQSVAPKTHPIKHPSKFGTVLRADHHHKIVLKFAVRDKATKEKVEVHQAFVTLVHSVTGAEIVFVAETVAGSVYQFELDVGAKSKDFGAASGDYKVRLTVGDAAVSNPISWHLADVNLAFENKPSAKADGGRNKPKPEIRHKFREPEKRPAAVISNGFTILCLAPFALLFVGWAMLGVNVSNLSLSPTTIGFHVGLGAIFCLYYWFWVSLNLFTTIKYLFMAGIVTFLCGNSLLSKVAEKRKAAA